MILRPSSRELYKKVCGALDALRAQRRGFGTLRHLAGDTEALGIDVPELWPLLIDLLEEIKISRPENCYDGQFPPQKSYQDEPAIKDEELWAFVWDSVKLRKRMYLKFVLTSDRAGNWYYYYIDCHETRRN